MGCPFKPKLNSTCFILWYVHKNMKYCMKWQFVALSSVHYLQLLSPSLKLTDQWMDAFALLTNSCWKHPPTLALALQLSCNAPIKITLRSPVKLVEDNIIGIWAKRKTKKRFYSVQAHTNCTLAALINPVNDKLSLNISAWSSSAGLL